MSREFVNVVCKEQWLSIMYTFFPRQSYILTINHHLYIYTCKKMEIDFQLNFYILGNIPAMSLWNKSYFSIVIYRRQLSKLTKSILYNCIYWNVIFIVCPFIYWEQYLSLFKQLIEISIKSDLWKFSSTA